MGYIGNQSSEAYSSVDKQVITGNGGTAYTLSHSVANANEIEVFVNNVRQEPGIAYTVSAGTSLAMTGNVESTDDFYVVFQGKAVQTARHPSDQDLEAVDGTFTGDLTVDTNTLKVDSTNNRVGIGTASPTLDGSLAGLSVNGSGTVLHVNDGDGATLKLTDPATGANRGLGITLQGTSAAISNCESGELRFGTGNTERGRFDASGNLLVGKTSSNIGTAGSEVTPTYISATRANNSPLFLNRTSSDGSIITFRKDNSAVGSLASKDGEITVGSGDVGLRFYAAGDAVIPVTATNQQVRDNAIDLGGGSFRFKNLYLSGGAYIGGTGSANHLDDYEEGTFTATLNGGSGHPGSRLQTTGQYIKVGNKVTVNFEFNNVNTASYSGHISVFGMPFAASNPSGTVRQVSGSVASYTMATWDSASTGLFARLNESGTEWYFYANRSNDAWYPLQHTVGTGRYLIVNATYITG